MVTFSAMTMSKTACFTGRQGTSFSIDSILGKRTKTKDCDSTENKEKCSRHSPSLRPSRTQPVYELNERDNRDSLGIDQHGSRILESQHSNNFVNHPVVDVSYPRPSHMVVPDPASIGYQNQQNVHPAHWNLQTYNSMALNAIMQNSATRQIPPWFHNRLSGMYHPGLTVPPNPAFLFHPYRKPKRIRTAFTPAQLLQLERAFEKNHYVVGQERKELAADLKLSETQVKVWFQNRRTKHKRTQSDDEYSGPSKPGYHDNSDDDEINIDVDTCLDDEDSESSSTL